MNAAPAWSAANAMRMGYLIVTGIGGGRSIHARSRAASDAPWGVWSVGWRPRSPSRTTRRATSATRSTVKPNSRRIVPAGALAPKWSMPMIAPSSPA